MVLFEYRKKIALAILRLGVFLDSPLQYTLLLEAGSGWKMSQHGQSAA